MAELIGDVGGSSSRWALIDGGPEPAVQDGLPGFNPASGDPTAFIAALRDRFANLAVAGITVYGAGCGTPDRRAVMTKAIREVFTVSVPLVVETDLLGAARGAYGSESGLILILGTGMNAGRYDGSSLHLPMPSLGYVLGDEGSGADIGKALVREALRENLPQPVMDRVFPGGLKLEEAIAHTYSSASPQVWLAAHAGRLAEVLDHPSARQLAAERFELMTAVLARYFPPERIAGVRAIGGIAWAYRRILEDVLAGSGFRLSAVERDPMQGLIRWHRSPR